MPSFADTDKTVFVARRADGGLYGVWTVQQFKDQEQLLETDPEVVSFRSRPLPSPSAVPEQNRRAVEALAERDPEAARFVEILKAAGLI